MCHESSGVALTDAIGIGKGSVTVEDVTEADLIVIAGQNPGTNHPRMLSMLEKAKANGAKIIAVNPLPEAGLIRFKDPQKVHGVVGHGIPIADEFVQIRLGGDMALFAGLGRLLLEADDRAPGSVIDRDFVDAHCSNFAELRGARPADRPGHRGRERRASTATQLDRVGDDVGQSRPHDCVLGDGPDAAPARGVDDLRDHQRAVDARDDRQARARACARCADTPTSRATARWASGRRCPRSSSPRSTTGSASSVPASTVSTPSTRSGRCATGARRCSSAWAATSPRPHRTPPSPRPRCAVAR